MSTITKKELIGRISKSTNTKQVVVRSVIQSFLDEIIVELAKNNRLEFRDFGVFEPRDCAPRTAQNPKTMERIHVPAKRAVRFKIGQLMKQKLSSQNAKV